MRYQNTSVFSDLSSELIVIHFVAFGKILLSAYTIHMDMPISLLPVIADQEKRFLPYITPNTPMKHGYKNVGDKKS